MSDLAYVYTPVERASRRLGVFLLIVLGLLLTMTLFFVKTQAKEARADVTRLETQIARHEAAIVVLTAEEAVLTSPQRLRLVSEERLGLASITVDQTKTLSDLDRNP